MTPAYRLFLFLIAALIAVAAAAWFPRPLAALVVAIAIAVIVLVTQRSGPAASADRAHLSPGPEDAVEPLQDLVRLLDPLREGVLVLGEDQVVLAANDAAAQILGRSPDQITGVSLIRAARDHELVQILRESSGVLTEITIADGARVLAYATPFALGPAQTLLSLQDVTALRRAERARQDLVANVSHELRTPITAALALAETLESGVDDPEQASRFHERLSSELERLREIVERLLRLSRIESEAEEFHIETLHADSLIRDTVDRVAPVAARDGVTIEYTCAPGLAMHGDGARVAEVLTNLLDNAIRFSPPGGSISVEASEANGMASVTVRDQGPGILPSDRLRVFERFYTGDSARTSGEAGTGIGLAIARHIISRLGGDIWVSDQTPGATLYFTLPLAVAEQQPDAPSTASARAQ